MVVFLNIFFCEEFNLVVCFNLVLIFVNDLVFMFVNNNYFSDFVKRVLEIGCYWFDGMLVDGIVVLGDLSSFGFFYFCFDFGKIYLFNDLVVCCLLGDICFGEVNLCGVVDIDIGGEGNIVVVVMYCGGCIV